MIISIDAEKVFDKIQHPFIMKTLLKMGIEGIYLNIVKAIYNKSTAYIIFNGKKLKAVPLRSITRQVVFTITTIIQHNFECPSYSSQRKKEIKVIQIGKKVKLSLLADDMNTRYI